MIFHLPVARQTKHALWVVGGGFGGLVHVYVGGDGVQMGG